VDYSQLVDNKGRKTPAKGPLEGERDRCTEGNLWNEALGPQCQTVSFLGVF
jgi:hypothetical protein